MAEGLTVTGGSAKNDRILVRSRSEDGNILIDFGVLMHEIGHALDHIVGLKQGGGGKPLRESKGVLDAINDKEQMRLPVYFQSDASEFVAEAFSQYSLDAARARKLYPKMVHAIESALTQLGFDLTKLHRSTPNNNNTNTPNNNDNNLLLVDASKLRVAVEKMIPPPPITTKQVIHSALQQTTASDVLSCYDSIKDQEACNTRLEHSSQPRQWP